MDINIEEYKSLDLYREPFSNSPDPEFLYQSRQHFGILQQLECSLKKEKGVCVVLGYTGTGKTILCRQLYRKISYEKNVYARVLSAHCYESSELFLREIADLFHLSEATTVNEIFDSLIYNYRLTEKTHALIIDNGHKIPEFCLSVLDRLSDLENAGRNFFQIVIFANKEFAANIEANPDFESKIVNYRILGPLSFRDTKQMISYRLKMANHNLVLSKKLKPKKIFSYPALVAIYLATGGYPRNIIVLCHRCIVTMLLKNTIKAGWFLVRSSAKRVLRNRLVSPESAVSAAIIVIPFIIIVSVFWKMSDNDFTKKFKDVPYLTEIIRTKDAGNGAIEDSDIRTQAPCDDKIIMVSDKKSDVNENSPVAGKTVQDKSLNQKTEPEILPALVYEDQSQQILIKNKAELMQSIPDLLGIVEVKRSDTLLVMLERVYGHSRTRYKKPVIAANRHISDIHSLDIGDLINFPTIIAGITTNCKDCFWVKVKSADNLNDAFNFVRKWHLSDKPVKLIPYFSADTGFQFDIVIKKLFVTKEEASGYIKKFSDDLALTPEIITFSIRQKVYFADPYSI